MMDQLKGELKGAENKQTVSIIDELAPDRENYNEEKFLKKLDKFYTEIDEAE